MNPRTLMWVQSRLGLGHLSRALTLGGYLAADGFKVTIAHGGPPAPTLKIPVGVDFVQLPVANAPDLSSSTILNENGEPVDDEWKLARIMALKDLCIRVAPDIFLTETFPLGRWLFSFELTHILNWLHQSARRPLIVSSVRDILARPSKTAKALAMIDLALEKYDLILCHGDDNLLKLPESFPETAKLTKMTRYTGYVTAAPVTGSSPRADIIVAAGGGAVGSELFTAAFGARSIWRRNDVPWTLVAGPRYGVSKLHNLAQNAPNGVVIEGAVENLSSRYATATLVVAQAGYNTVCEALSQGARLVVVPYATDKETEQLIRAERFQALDLLVSVDPNDLSPQTLIAAMERALDLPPPIRKVRFTGGQESARILCRELVERRQ